MKKQKSDKVSMRVDTMAAFAGMGEAVDILMKAAPCVFEERTAPGKEVQGKSRRRKAA